MSTAAPEIATDEAAWALALGRRVRGQLAEHEKTQEDAAVILGLSQAAVNRRLKGHVPFAATELRRIALWLGVPLNGLFPTLPHLDSNQEPAGLRPGVRVTGRRWVPSPVRALRIVA